VIAAVKVAVMAGGEAVDGGDWAAWALVWLSRNIPLAPAARIRPRWRRFMVMETLHIKLVMGRASTARAR
jgi:hypothetical protein